MFKVWAYIILEYKSLDRPWIICFAKKTFPNCLQHICSFRKIEINDKRFFTMAKVQSNQCSEFLVKKKTRCTKKVYYAYCANAKQIEKSKTLPNLCEFGCWKHTKNQKIASCYQHRRETSCWYECVVCGDLVQQRKSSRLRDDCALIVLENASEFYCSKRCFDQNDGFNPDTKYVKKKCEVCDQVCIGPEKKRILCKKHREQFSEHLSKGLFYKKCMYDTIPMAHTHARRKNQTASCFNYGWVEETKTFWCDTHVCEKDKYLKGYIAKYCKYHEIQKEWKSTCHEIGLVANLGQDWWCDKHTQEKQAYEQGYVLKKCRYNQEEVGICKQSKMQPPDQDWWCIKHTKQGKLFAQGLRHKVCRYNLLQMHSCYDLGNKENQAWVPKDQPFWCPTHREFGEKYGQDFVIKKCTGVRKKGDYCCTKTALVLKNNMYICSDWRCKSPPGYSRAACKWGEYNFGNCYRSISLPSGQEYWCPEHLHIKELYDKNIPYKECQIALDGQICSKSGFANELGIFLCPRHKEYEKYYKKGYHYHKCEANVVKITKCEEWLFKGDYCPKHKHQQEYEQEFEKEIFSGEYDIATRKIPKFYKKDKDRLIQFLLEKNQKLQKILRFLTQ